MGMLGWTGDNGDPDNFLHTAAWLRLGAARPRARTSPSSASSRSTNFVVKAKTTTDQAERTKLYEQAQVIFKEQAPWFTIAHAVQLRPMSKKVRKLQTVALRPAQLLLGRHQGITIGRGGGNTAPFLFEGRVKFRASWVRRLHLGSLPQPAAKCSRLEP